MSIHFAISISVRRRARLLNHATLSLKCVKIGGKKPVNNAENKKGCSTGLAEHHRGR